MNKYILTETLLAKDGHKGAFVRIKFNASAAEAFVSRSCRSVDDELRLIFEKQFIFEHFESPQPLVT
jgi:hypothetical protein